MHIDVPVTGTNSCQDVFDNWRHMSGAGRDLTLVRVKDNPHDPAAVAVHYNGRQMGWVGKTHSKLVAEQLDAGHAVVSAKILDCFPSAEPMKRLKIRWGFEGEEPASGLLPLNHIVKAFGAPSQSLGNLAALKTVPVGTVLQCVSAVGRSTISIVDGGGNDLAWFRKEEPGAMLSVALRDLANMGYLLAMVRTQNPLTVSLHKKGEVPLTGVNAAKAAIASALITANTITSTDDSRIHANTFAQPAQKESTMNTLNVNAFFSRIFAINTKAASEAAYLETGRIANKTVARIVIGRLPWLARFYAKTPLGSLAIANSAIILAQQLRPNDERISKLAAAMATSAYQELIQTLDVEGMVDQLLAEPAIKRALDKVEAKGGAVVDGSTFEGRPGAQ